MEYIRKNCITCTRKHLAQALVLLLEYAKSPEEFELHFDFAIGHMAEAEDECSLRWPDLAKAIRDERTKMIEDDNYWADFNTLLSAAKIYSLQEADRLSRENSKSPPKKKSS